MRTPLTEDDQDLDRQWRETFGEPMPILGGGDIFRQILLKPTCGAGKILPEVISLSLREAGE